MRETLRRGEPWYVLTNLGPEARLLRRRQLESLLDDYRDLVDDEWVLRNRAAVLDDLGDICFASECHLEAAAYYELALQLHRQVKDRQGEATTLNNIGRVYDALGDKRQALAYYEQALPLRRQVSDRWGESITRYNMAMVCEALGDLARAEEELTIVVDLDAAIEHPDLASDRAALERVQAKRKASGIASLRSQ